MDPELRHVPTLPHEPDKYAWDWLVTLEDGRQLTMSAVFCGTDLSTDPEYLPDRVAEAIRTKGRSEIEPIAAAAPAIRSIEVRVHHPGRPLVQLREENAAI